MKIVVMALAIMMLPLAASAATFEIAAGAWYVQPDGDLAYIPDGTSTNLDLEDDFGFDSEWEPMIRARIEPGGFLGLNLRVTPMGFDASEHGDFEFAFGDTVFFGGDTIDSEFFLNIYDAALYGSTPFLETGAGGIDLDFGVGARVITLEAEVEGVPLDDDIVEGNVLEENPDETVTYPMVFLGLEMQPTDMISLELEAWGMSISNDDIYSLSGMVKFIPGGGPFMINGGYRAEFLNIEKSGLAIDADFTGPFAEVGLRF
ncbi:MAG: hypothetical protein WAR22_06180 [Desulfomonilia bacterium]